MWKKIETSEAKKGDKVRIPLPDGGFLKGIVSKVSAMRFIFLTDNPSEGIGAYKVERFEKPKITDDEE